MIELNRAKEILISEGYTCVLCRGDVTHTSTERGVKPLVRWLEQGLDGNGFSAAVLDIEDVSLAYTAIRSKMKEMNISLE